MLIINHRVKTKTKTKTKKRNRKISKKNYSRHASSRTYRRTYRRKDKRKNKKTRKKNTKYKKNYQNGGSAPPPLQQPPAPTRPVQVLLAASLVEARLRGAAASAVAGATSAAASAAAGASNFFQEKITGIPIQGQRYIDAMNTLYGGKSPEEVDRNLRKYRSGIETIKADNSLTGPEKKQKVETLKQSYSFSIPKYILISGHGAVVDWNEDMSVDNFFTLVPRGYKLILATSAGEVLTALGAKVDPKLGAALGGDKKAGSGYGLKIDPPEWNADRLQENPSFYREYTGLINNHYIDFKLDYDGTIDFDNCEGGLWQHELRSVSFTCDDSDVHIMKLIRHAVGSGLMAAKVKSGWQDDESRRPYNEIDSTMRVTIEGFLIERSVMMRRMRTELQALEVTALQHKAVEMSVPDEAHRDALDTGDPKSALIAAILSVWVGKLWNWLLYHDRCHSKKKIIKSMDDPGVLVKFVEPISDGNYFKNFMSYSTGNKDDHLVVGEFFRPHQDPMRNLKNAPLNRGNMELTRQSAAPQSAAPQSLQDMLMDLGMGQLIERAQAEGVGDDDLRDAEGGEGGGGKEAIIQLIINKIGLPGAEAKAIAEAVDREQERRFDELDSEEIPSAKKYSKIFSDGVQNRIDNGYYLDTVIPIELMRKQIEKSVVNYEDKEEIKLPDLESGGDYFDLAELFHLIKEKENREKQGVVEAERILAEKKANENADEIAQAEADLARETGVLKVTELPKVIVGSFCRGGVVPNELVFLLDMAHDGLPKLTERYFNGEIRAGTDKLTKQHSLSSKTKIQDFWDIFYNIKERLGEFEEPVRTKFETVRKRIEDPSLTYPEGGIKLPALSASLIFQMDLFLMQQNTIIAPLLGSRG